MRPQRGIQRPQRGGTSQYGVRKKRLPTQGGQRRLWWTTSWRRSISPPLDLKTRARSPASSLNKGHTVRECQIAEHKLEAVRQRNYSVTASGDLEAYPDHVECQGEEMRDGDKLTDDKNKILAPTNKISGFAQYVLNFLPKHQSNVLSACNGSRLNVLIFLHLKQE
ncbi:MAG: hypothetical protein GY696_30955 [Gammaproteobacteria bacterium]|nr:hypothetical protein [Gammaproteobacteria bacterium]